MSAEAGPSRVLTFPVESAAERATHSTLAACEDVDAAIWQAKTIAELAAVAQLIAALVRRLEISACVAKTRQDLETR